jgi:transposase
MKTNIIKQPTTTMTNPNAPIDSDNPQRAAIVTATATPQLKLGLDVHLSFIMVVVQEGHLTPKAPRKMDSYELIKAVRAWRSEGYQVHSVQESCGMGFTLHRALEAAGVHSLVITPILLNERNTRRKTDKLDARALCCRLSRYLDGNREELRPIRIPSEEEQRAREVSRRREFFQREIRRLANRGNALVMEYCYQSLPKGWWGPRKWKILIGLDPWVRERLAELRELIISFKKQFDALTLELQERVRHQPIPLGLGALTLAVLDAEICNWNRFSNRKSVGSYTGCCPGVHGSGGHERYGHIDRCGNPRVRRQLVEAVWRLLKWQPQWHARKKHLPRLMDSVAQRKKVVVALARQLAIDVWRWRTGRCTLEDLGLVSTIVL